MPDGSEELIPDVWFCEMNRDPLHNSCEAPEEEYKAPEVPLVPLLPVIPPNMNRFPRPAKANDPDSIRAKLKLLTDDDLQAAYDSIDLERVFREEFGENLETARSHAFHSEVPPPAVKPTGRTKAPSNQTKKEIDLDRTWADARKLTRFGYSIFPEEVAVGITRDFK
jgi:hypothetical protein